MSFEGNKVLVTGGCGFIGSHLVDALVARGADVQVIDNLFSGVRRNTTARLNIVDILDRQAVGNVIGSDTSVLYHLAAHFGHPRSLKDPDLNLQVNLQGTLNILNECCRRKVGRVVFISTFSAYGPQERLPLTEDLPCIPTSLYDVSKAAGEYYMHSYHHLYKLDTVTLRLANAYGPRDPQGPYRSAVSNLIGQVMRGEQPTLQFEGLATRDFIHVSDLVEGLILAGTVDGVGGQVFNLCTGVETTVRDMVELIIEAAKSSVKPILVPAKHYYTSRMVGSYEKAARSLGFEPKVALKEGIAKTVAWCQANEQEFSEPQPYSYLSG